MTPAVAALASSQQPADVALDVVLELEQPGVAADGSRAERIAQQKASFQAIAEPVKAVVLQSGGSIEAEAWINCTIKARVPTSAIQHLKEVEGIVTIDLPHRIERE